jgi:hypothetical protein
MAEIVVSGWSGGVGQTPTVSGGRPLALAPWLERQAQVSTACTPDAYERRRPTSRPRESPHDSRGGRSADYQNLTFHMRYGDHTVPALVDCDR